VKPCVLSLCDRTGNMVKPWADAGFFCVLVDLKHPPGYSYPSPNVLAIGADVRHWLQYEMHYTPAIVFAFPPCTHLASSGARWFADKGLPPLIHALTLVDRCREIAEWCRCPWMIENPVGRLSSCWRKPDHAFDPCDYGGYLTPPGDVYTKRTCLWTGGGFVMPEPRRVEPADGSKMHRMPPSADRADRRSVTPAGFARAVFEANVVNVAPLFSTEGINHVGA
jgi:hypothetical protein